MTDNEIIEKLQFSLKLGDSPIGKGFGTIIDKQLLADTLDIVCRQQADIERLKTENERVKTNIYKMAIDKALAEKVKAEAIKEFADKVKQNLSFGKYITVEQIDNLAKEMGCGE